MRHWPALVVACALLFLAGIDSPVVRHAAVLGLGRCSLQQYSALPAAPDFLALGSSRVRQGISTEEVSRASGGRLSDNYNLGRSGLSALRDYLLLRDLLDRGVRPRAVFVELDLDALRRPGSLQPVRVPDHAAMLMYRDLGLLQLAHPDLGPASRARLTVLAGLAKVRGAIGAVVSGAPLLALLDGPQPAPRDCQPPADAPPVRVGLAQQAQQRRAAQAGEALPFTLTPESPAARQALFFLGRIRALCRLHGIALVVGRHGAAHEPALAPSAVAALKSVVPEFIQPPSELVRRTWEDFDDRAHMGRNARLRYSAWLASQLPDRAAP